MQAKLFKAKFLTMLLAGATALLPAAVAAQTAAPNIMARPVAGARPIPINDAQQAAVWARTAEYLYRNDPALQSISAELLATVQNYSVGYFERGLNAAVKKEMELKQCLLKDSHVQTFKSKVFDPLQALPRPAPTLAQDIIAKLRDNHPERQPGGANANQFQAFARELTQLAGTLPQSKLLRANTTPDTRTPAETADNPMGQAAAEAPDAPAADTPAADNFKNATPVAAAPASALLGWTAFSLALLSLVGVVYLLVKQSGRSAPAPAPAAPAQPATPRISSKAITFEEMKKYVQRELDKQLAAPAPAAPLSAPYAAPAPPAAVSAPLAAAPVPAPRRRVQYVSEAPFNRAFLSRALSEQPSAYSIFAIESTEQQPNQGTFTVTGNLASHVRDHRNVLEPVCDYAGSYPVGSETRIVTETPGQVRRRGEDWEVVRPAKVRFEA